MSKKNEGSIMESSTGSPNGHQDDERARPSPHRGQLRPPAPRPHRPRPTGPPPPPPATMAYNAVANPNIPSSSSSMAAYVRQAPPQGCHGGIPFFTSNIIVNTPNVFTTFNPHIPAVSFTTPRIPPPPPPRMCQRAPVQKLMDISFNPPIKKKKEKTKVRVFSNMRRDLWGRNLELKTSKNSRHQLVYPLTMMGSPMVSTVYERDEIEDEEEGEEEYGHDLFYLSDDNHSEDDRHDQGPGAGGAGQGIMA